MKVTLLKPIGFCQGVIKAISKAYQVKNANKDKNVFVLGKLVHNEKVIKDLESKGIFTLDVNSQDISEIIKKIDEDDIVILTAHGHSKNIEKLLDDRRIKYFDTTCEKVKENMRIIKDNEANGIIYIGKKNHPETMASLSVSNNVFLYDINEGIDYSKVIFSSPIVINQTTLSFLEIRKIHLDILNHLPSALIYDEVCNATRLRQEMLLSKNEDYEIIFIVGSIHSSNTEQLYRIAKDRYKDSFVVKVNSLEDVKKLDLSNYHTCLIGSGTSTPLEIIEEIKDYLEGMN